MKEMRIRPKSDYMRTATWEELFSLGEFWDSEITFHLDEIHFLNDLINKYYIPLINEENLDSVEKMAIHVHDAQRRADDIIKEVKKHQVSIALLIKNAFSHDDQKFREAHVKLDDEIALFLQKVRSIKKEVFDTAKKVMKSEKMRHLLPQE